MVFQPTYFSPVIQYIAIAAAGELIFETEDNFQKQTFRNRCYIYGANGKLLLGIPIVHENSGRRQKTREVKIDTSFGWQKMHKKSLASAYRSSPYFEYYEEEVLSVLSKSYTFLLDLNLRVHELVMDALQLEKKASHTLAYHPTLHEDYRELANAKLKSFSYLDPYQQVFSEKFGFIPNLSILDLLFNEGPNAQIYLEQHGGFFKK
jgi:hypothetical protein